jgi:glycosyltransferase involved in cell wall biosynthesis
MDKFASASGTLGHAKSVVVPSISVIITAHNEGEELARTLRSVFDNTRNLAEVIVVDDGSQDGSCDAVASDYVRVIRHDRRIGVAVSRDEGSRAATGDVLCYLDGHQRVARHCLDRCAQLAIERDAITCPGIRDYGLFAWTLYGASFRLCPKHGYFSGDWRGLRQLRRVKRVTGLRAPPYLIPRALYPHVAWSRCLRGWGASEASIVVKSFFMGIGILHMTGPVARHRFQKYFSYPTTWEGVWRNQAIIARVCFDDATWFRFWLPRVFEGHLGEEARTTLESAKIQEEHAVFLGKKVRTDHQFWTELVRRTPPDGV